jgi:hypothetical protein
MLEETVEITTEEKGTPSEKTEVEIVVKPDVEKTRPSEVPTEEILTTISTSVFSEVVPFSSVVISIVSSNVTGISSVGTSDGRVSSITEVEVVVKPEMEETRPSEVPTEEIPVTFEETIEITTEEKETTSEKIDHNFNLCFL